MNGFDLVLVGNAWTDSVRRYRRRSLATRAILAAYLLALCAGLAAVLVALN